MPMPMPMPMPGGGTPTSLSSGPGEALAGDKEEVEEEEDVTPDGNAPNRALVGERSLACRRQQQEQDDEKLHRLFIESKLPYTFWSGAMEGSLVKHNTSSADYAAKRAYCVLVGYTLYEFDNEQEAKAMLWPRGEADVIGVSAAPANSAALRSSSLTTSAKSEVTFVYTTNAGERVCAVANSARECEKWIVALTLGVELLLVAGMPESAGGAGLRVAHRPPAPETTATHCASSGQQFGYTVARHYCAACGRAFAASQMAPLPLPLPGIGVAHAARVSDACAQAQQLLNASRCRARFLDVAAHAAALEDTLLKKYKAEGKELWLRAVVEEDENFVQPPLSGEGGATAADVERVVESRKAKDILAAKTAYARYAGLVVDALQDDVAALVNELHYLCDLEDTLPSSSAGTAGGGRAAQPSGRGLGGRASSAEGSVIGGSDDGSTTSAHTPQESSSSSSITSPGERAPSSAAAQASEHHRGPSPSGERTALSPQASRQSLSPSSSVDHHVPDKTEIRATLTSPSARSTAVRDVVASLLSHRVADDDPVVPEELARRRRHRPRRGLVFWLPQIAHVYYRQLPPRSADGAVRATLVEELLLSASRRSFHFALRLAWTLVAYLEDRGGSPARRPHVLRLLVELEAAAANACAERQSDDENGPDDDDLVESGGPDDDDLDAQDDDELDDDDDDASKEVPPSFRDCDDDDDDFDDDDDQEEGPEGDDDDEAVEDEVELITFPVTFRDRGLSKERRRADDPWTLRPDTVANATMACRGPVGDEPSPFAGAVALELLPRAPAWLALELHRAAVALRAARDTALAALDVPTQELPPKTASPRHHVVEPPDDVLAREMRFVRALCDVAETMRSVDLAHRPARLQSELRALPRRTPLGHSPIGPTTSDYLGSRRVVHLGRVARIPPNEGHVFKTKARAPTLVLLETVDDDVALALEKDRLLLENIAAEEEQDDDDRDDDDRAAASGKKKTTREEEVEDHHPPKTGKEDEDAAADRRIVVVSGRGTTSKKGAGSPGGGATATTLEEVGVPPMANDFEESKDERGQQQQQRPPRRAAAGPQKDDDDDAGDRKKTQMKALLADKLGEAPSTAKQMAFYQQSERVADADEECTARRVASMPGILAAAGAADDDEDENDPDSAARAAAKMGSMSSPAAKPAKPLSQNSVRRAASVNSGLAALPALPEKSRLNEVKDRGPYDNDDHDDGYYKGRASYGTPRKLGTRAEVARALRKRATLNLNADRLAVLDVDDGFNGVPPTTPTRTTALVEAVAAAAARDQATPEDSSSSLGATTTPTTTTEHEDFVAVSSSAPSKASAAPQFKPPAPPPHDEDATTTTRIPKTQFSSESSTTTRIPSSSSSSPLEPHTTVGKRHGGILTTTPTSTDASGMEKKEESSSSLQQQQQQQQQQAQTTTTTTPVLPAGGSSSSSKRRKPGFGEPWSTQRERVRKASPIGDEVSWNLTSLIVKSNDDLRQEVCALQIIAACNDAFEAAGLAGDDGGLWLRHYSIVPTGASTGVIETMADAVSLDALKKNLGGATLASHFREAHGGEASPGLAKARQCFISSMAAYSLVCHLLGLKDRHNGNILLDKHGHVIHIDFGFMLGQAPGGSFSLERVPFKLTTDHVEVMGGWSSDSFADFVVLLACGFAALQAQADNICSVVEIMAKDSPFPCFRAGPAAVDKMRTRLKLHLTTPEQVANHVAELVKQSFNAYGTRQYDSFQYLTNGIYS